MVPADSEGGWAINGEMLLPPQFDASKKYSVLVYVYGGPHSQTVSDVTSHIQIHTVTLITM